MNGGEVNELELLREQVSNHQRILEEHGTIMKRHSDMLERVTQVQNEHALDIKDINANYTKLENIIYSESRETREMMRGITEKQFNLIESLSGYKEASAVRESDLQKVKTEKWSDIIVKLIGLATIVLSSGGILFAIVNAIITK